MNNKGFTLIELVVVIVILGILAATVAPKFINLKAEAETSVLQGIKASMESASAMVYGKSIVAGNQNIEPSESPTITLNNGESLDIGYGYPIVPPPIPGLGDPEGYWKNLLDLGDEFSIRVATNGALMVYFTDMDTPTTISDSCIVAYQAAKNEFEKPIIQVNNCL